MKKLIIGWILVQFSVGMATAQLTENFSDGNFTANPSWVGNTADWIVNANLQLQSNNTTASSSFYLSTASTLATSTQWEFYVRLNFNTSSANYVDAYLTASASDLSATTTTGYFVRIGNTQDEISLYRKEANGTSTEIIDGIDGVTNTSDNTLRIRVIRDAANQFFLYRDITGTGTSYINEGTAVDATYTTSAFFGFFVRQSTSSFFQKHYFDDILIQPFSPDVTPPAIQNVVVTSLTTLDILFSEPVESTSSQATGNYVVNNGIGSPVSAQRDAANASIVHLTFANSFPNGVASNITINGVRDLAGNTLSNGTASFSFFVPQRYDVVIDEIMADPFPVVGLPNAEYVELKNVSGRELNLQGWRLSSATTTSGAFGNVILPADSFLIITSTSSAPLLAPYGRVLGVSSFPALDNTGTTLSLFSKEGKTIHAVPYTIGWYGNAVKSEGGWSLEMIDPKNPCAGSENWKASTHSSGGTPGRKNSVDATLRDQTPPSLERVYALDNTTAVLVFDEPLDSASATNVANYTVSPAIAVTGVSVPGPLFNTVQLRLASPLAANTVYSVTARNASDCKGNAIGTRNTARLGLSQEAVSGDVVINEILFNPRPNGFDYVEIYNRSTKVVDAGKLFIANRNNAGAISSLNRMSQNTFLLFPGDYLVVTEDLASLEMNYLVKNKAAVSVISDLPSFPDNEGTVVVVNSLGVVADEVKYSDDWHFDLIAEDEGVSLERIDPAGPSQDENNWHSAASTAGYGTPGYQNSQFKQTGAVTAALAVTPSVFSPDNDGMDDIAIIKYQAAQTGYVANITIFDAGGRPVRYLVKNAVLGLTGSWVWDGLSEQRQKLPIGTYIIYTEFFNLQGKKERFKNTIVLARKLN